MGKISVGDVGGAKHAGADSATDGHRNMDMDQFNQDAGKRWRHYLRDFFITPSELVEAWRNLNDLKRLNDLMSRPASWESGPNSDIDTGAQAATNTSATGAQATTADWFPWLDPSYAFTLDGRYPFRSCLMFDYQAFGADYGE